MPHWDTFELMQFFLSLFLVVLMTLFRIIPLISSYQEAQRNSAAAEQNRPGYVTFFRDRISRTHEGGVADDGRTYTVDFSQFSNDSGYAGRLYAMRSKFPSTIDAILLSYENTVCMLEGEETTVGQCAPEHAIPERLLQLACENQEALSFVANYPTDHSKGNLPGEITKNRASLPLLLQWDGRWGYHAYGDTLMGCLGSAPTCFAMALNYFYPDNGKTPDVIGNHLASNGYFSSDYGTSWSLISYAAAGQGLSAQELSLTEDVMAQSLADGQLILCILSDGGSAGHYVLLTGCENGLFTMNDPSSPSNSVNLWSFDALSSQIQNLCALSPA